MSVSSLMRKMAEAGAPLEAIMLAVEALESQVEALESQKQKEIERKARRAAQKSNERSRDKEATVARQKSDKGGNVAAMSHDFAAFWEIWPNRVGKAEAERSFRNIGKRPDYDLAVILSGVKRYIADKPSDRGWLNPATFLNQRRWNDEPAAPTNGNHGGVIAALGRLDFGDDDIFARPEPMPSTRGKGQGATAYGLLPKG